jgi:hypothetical protein
MGWYAELTSMEEFARIHDFQEWNILDHVQFFLDVTAFEDDEHYRGAQP